MKTYELKIPYTEYDSMDELPEEERALLLRARDSSRSAYAPYSNFYVGAALLLENGQVVTGNNQENVAYPSGLCAERVAIYAAGAQYPGVPVKAIAVTCHSPSFDVSEPLSPCGACRQAIAEYENRYQRPIRILLAGETGKIRAVASIAQLLPFVFQAEQLKKA